MEKLYYERPYVKTFEAEVTDCKPGKKGTFYVTLDRTGFYPEGGGQPADQGTLGSANVLDVHEKDETVVHTTDAPLEPGTRVTGTIDWERRFDHMQNHTGEHILSGLVHKHYGYDNVGFHMGKDEVTVDFNGVLTMEQIEEIEDQVNEIIFGNVPVVELFPTEEEIKTLDYRSKKELTGQVRIIEIPGGDVCACCGTHVITTGEIGLLKVTGMIHYKGGVRLSMLCGRKAMEDYRKKQKIVTSISVALSAKMDKITDIVEKMREDNGHKEYKLNQLYMELFQSRLQAYPQSEEPLLVFEPDLAPVQIRQFCTLLYENQKGSAVLVCSGGDGVWQYALGSAAQDMRILSKSLNGKLNGRGGGSALISQGTFHASEEDIRKAFLEQ